MYNSFITIVGIITHDEFLLKSFISKTQNILKENFEDFEIILINNGVIFDVDSTLKDLKYIQQDIRILNPWFMQFPLSRALIWFVWVVEISQEKRFNC